MSAELVAAAGMMAAMGARNMLARKSTPVVRAVRPVRPPASTPEADSTNVVTVDVPVHAPVTVPMASASSASRMRGMLPSLSTMPARLAVPTRVPMVSNMSMMQNVMTSVTTVNQPISPRATKSNLNRVVAAMSPNAGTNDAPLSDANGFVCRKMASPAQ